jgi:hypothetical protein
VAAQNNDTFGVLMLVRQIAEGLAAINNPSYFLFEGPPLLLNNGTTLADMPEASATVSNHTIKNNNSSSLAGNQYAIRGGAGSANTTSGGI